MPRLSSPMAASSGSGRKSGLPPGGFMPAVRSGSNSSPRSNIVCTARARRGRDAMPATPSAAARITPERPGGPALPYSPARRRAANRPVRWHLRSASRGASCGLAAGDEAAASRSGVVARDTRQSAEGHARPCRSRRPGGGGARARPPSPHRCDRDRGRDRFPLQLRYDPSSPRAVPRRSNSCGSSAPTICAAFIAGRTGAVSPAWCRSPWSTAWAQAFTPWAASPRTRCAGESRKARRRCCLRSHPPAWVYLHGLKSPLSSTALRGASAVAKMSPIGRHDVRVAPRPKRRFRAFRPDKPGDENSAGPAAGG